jgi:hypothetical protein
MGAPRIRFYADRWWAVCPDTRAQIFIEDRVDYGNDFFWRVTWGKKIYAGTASTEKGARAATRRVVERIRKGKPPPSGLTSA